MRSMSWCRQGVCAVLREDGVFGQLLLSWQVLSRDNYFEEVVVGINYFE